MTMDAAVDSNADEIGARLNAALSEQADGIWHARHGELTLQSHFQPIYSFPHRRVVGHEALVRVFDAAGKAILPLRFFDSLAGFDEQLHADRLCRLLHIHNFVRQDSHHGWLFLNIHPSVFVHGALHGPTLARAMDMLDNVGQAGLPTHRLVFEVTEAVMARDDDFEAAVAAARETGCLLALDDFGAGHSNFDRVWRIQPEIVKLDRSLLRRAMDSSRVARVMTQMVSLLHECGALVLLEGVETQDEALLALDSDVDLVQGFAFGHPAPGLLGESGVSAAIDEVWQLLDERHQLGRQTHAQRIAPYQAALKKALPGLRQGQTLRQACAALLAMPGVQFCYLLDELGREICPAVEPDRTHSAIGVTKAVDRRFEPLDHAGQARWARRPYFRRAIAELGQVQITRPYLSLHGARMCVTVSLAFWSQAKTQVICCDLDWVSGDV